MAIVITINCMQRVNEDGGYTEDMFQRDEQENKKQIQQIQELFHAA